jgi:signal transduction histidine kinase
MPSLLHGKWAGVRVRTTLVAVGAVGLAAAVGGLIIVSQLDRNLQDNVDSALVQQAQTLAGTVQSGSSESVRLPARLGDSNVEQLYAADGRVIVASPEIASAPALGRSVAPGTRQVRTVSLALDQDASYRLLLLGVRDREGAELTIAVAQSLELAESSRRVTVKLLGVAGPALLLLVAGLTYWLTGRALRPVEQMRANVARIGGDNLDERVALPAAHDEVWALGSTLNVMLGRLEASAVAQRQFVSDASHELRSPLTAIRTTVEVAAAHPEPQAWDRSAAVVLEECGRIEHLVADLLLLATGDEGGRKVHRVDVDLDDVARYEAERVGATFVGEAIRVTGDPQALTRALRNVVDNAARHAAGRVVVTLRAGAGDAVLEVADDGPGIPAADRERVFDRFVRLDEARSRAGGGTGLGLAIARQLVATQRGTIAFVDVPSGALCRITVPLP